jgi:hypothetical protein
VSWEQPLADLSAVAARQLGLVARAQAERLGVDAAVLDDLATAGLLTLLDWEVYEVAGATSPRFGYPYAAWLALSPAAFAWERPTGPADAVVSHESACRVLGIGSPSVGGISFIAPIPLPEPRSTRLQVAQLSPEEVTVAAGVPVTTAHRTVIDLLEDHTDHGEVRRVLTDAVRLDLLDLASLHRDLAELGGSFPVQGPAFAHYFLPELDVRALSVRNLRAFAALVLPDQVEETRAALAQALPEIDDAVLRDVAAEVAGRVGPV